MFDRHETCLCTCRSVYLPTCVLAHVSDCACFERDFTDARAHARCRYRHPRGLRTSSVPPAHFQLRQQEAATGRVRRGLSIAMGKPGVPDVPDSTVKGRCRDLRGFADV